MTKHIPVPKELLNRVLSILIRYRDSFDKDIAIAEKDISALLDGPGVEPVGYLVTREDGPYKGSQHFSHSPVAPIGHSAKPLYLAAPSAPVQAVPDGFCTWKPMDDEFMPGTYEGSCGTAWSFTEGGVVENDIRYCPQCGRKVVTEHAPQPPATTDKENGE